MMLPMMMLMTVVMVVWCRRQRAIENEITICRTHDASLFVEAAVAAFLLFAF
jgi:hypothetical protein